jgi:hypothetical protein
MVFSPFTHADIKPSPTAQELQGMQALFSSFAMEFSGQAWHEAPPPPLYWFPTHDSQDSMSAFRYSPTEHGRQADLSSVDTSFTPQDVQLLDPPVLNSFKPHLSQTVSRSAVHGCVRPNPTRHVRQGRQALFSSFAMEFSGQAWHEAPPPPLYWFPTHDSQDSMSAFRYSPTEHGRQADFTSFETSLISQGVQVLLPPALNSLELQTSQDLS